MTDKEQEKQRAEDRIKAMGYDKIMDYVFEHCYKDMSHMEFIFRCGEVFATVNSSLKNLKDAYGKGQ